MRQLIISWLLLLVISPAVSAGADFYPGQVVVQGKAGDFSNETIIKQLPHAGLLVIKSQPGHEQAKARRLQQLGFRAAVNRRAHTFFQPDDPYFPLQWHFSQIQASAAWDISLGSSVTVAVLDTGLASGLSDGIGCVTPGFDVVNNDNDPEDGDGHGTHVAGTIGQTSNNHTGVSGLAFAACVMPVKVLDDNGSGSFADIADGIYFAVANGARVINMSLGTNARFAVTNDPLMDNALDYASQNNVTVVAASGNDGHRKNVSYPAIYPSVIAVGATDARGNVTRYSNQGSGLDLVAPGGDTGRDDNRDGYADGVLQETRLSGDINQQGYYFFQGTSMASPHVAAAAAMLISHGIDTPDTIRERLMATAKDIADSGFDSQSGAGLLQVYDALTGVIAPPPVVGSDNDGDGFSPEDGDCDDNNANVYPGHNDSRGRWGRDGVDNDCNGIIDG